LEEQIITGDGFDRVQIGSSFILHEVNFCLSSLFVLFGFRQDCSDIFGILQLLVVEFDTFVLQLFVVTFDVLHFISFFTEGLVCFSHDIFTVTLETVF